MPASAGASVVWTLHLARRVSIREVISCGPRLSSLVHARSSSSCRERDLLFLGTSLNFGWALILLVPTTRKPIELRRRRIRESRKQRMTQGEGYAQSSP